MKFSKWKIRRFALSVVIFVWSAVHVKRIARKERFSLMLEMDADVLRESFRVYLMEHLQHAVARRKAQAVISIIKHKERVRKNIK